MVGKQKNKIHSVARATLRDARISPQKVRLVLDLVRGRQVEPALQILQHSPKKGSKIVGKLLKSAISNASEHAGADVDKLWITGAYADMGRVLKRYLPRAQGRATKIRKVASHITLTLGEQ